MTGIIREVTIGDCRLIQADCLDVLPTLEGVDAVVTDPPYGELGYEWDTRVEFVDVLPDVKSAAVFGREWLFTEVGAAFEKRGLPFRYEMIWEKPIGRLWNYKRPIRCHEFIAVWGSTETADFKRGFGGQPRSVMNHKTFQAYLRNHPEATGHPTQKPYDLIYGIVASVSDGSILDPFMGSGTTGVACAKLGRRFIGIEIDPGYFDIACKRIEDAYKQPDMFVERPTRPEQLTIDGTEGP